MNEYMSKLLIEEKGFKIHYIKYKNWKVFNLTCSSEETTSLSLDISLPT